MSELTGKVALVTGGGRGIGRAVALDLARRGAQVAVAARTTHEIERVAAEIKELGRESLALAVDLSDSHATRPLVSTVADVLGPITILINNAAVTGPFGVTWELDPNAWERALTINLIAPFRLAHAVLPHMIEAGWGRLINVSSGAARNPVERAGPYSVSKAGLDMLTRQLGLELEGTGVAAIAVYPGVVDTAMQTTIREQPAAIVGQRVAQRFRQFYTSGQLQKPERPARLIAALAGDAGGAFNGQIVDVYSDAAQRLIRDARA